MRRLNRNERILACMIAVVAAIAHQRMLLQPMQASSTDLGLRVNAARVQLEMDKRTYDELKSRAHVAERSLPKSLLEEFDHSNDRFSKVVTDLMHETHSAPMRLRRFSTEKPSVTPEYEKSLVSLDIDASFPAIGKFLERLGDLPLLAEVDSLEIYRLENDLKKCSARIRLTSYVVKP